MNIIQLVQGDTNPDLEFQIVQGGNPVDLTGCTVYFTMKKIGGSVKIDNAVCTIVDAENGLAKYEWQEGDTSEAGNYEGEVRVVDASGEIQTGYEKIKIRIREKIQ